ncbi:MAG: FkbM family methyltransferase [Proteocatella sp.]
MSKDIKENIKGNIKKLVEQGQLYKAKSLLEEYKKLENNDADIYSIMGIVSMMEGNMEEAERILKEGIYKYDSNFDLAYNLAYFYQYTEQKELSIKYYKKAFKNTSSKVEAEEVEKLLRELGADKIEEDKDLEIISRESRTKIVFFHKQGMDSFLSDIIRNLSIDYEVKKITVTEYSQIDSGMEWADICWFEWCDELVIYGSKLQVAKQRKIICRLHSYEAFTNYPEQVMWNNVDKLIFVAEHLKRFAIEKYSVNEENTEVIPNGVNLTDWTFKKRKPGFKIAYVGYINYKKGPMLLLHTFKALYDQDSRCNLYMAGQFQDNRDVLYFKQMIKEFGIERNVHFEGWQNNVDNWLDDKDYILCTSVLESQNMSVMQAMAKGIKPLIHNFVGAKNIYQEKYIWNTIDEAVEMIVSEEYKSCEYRSFIEENYSLKKEIQSTKEIIDSLASVKKIESKYLDIVEFNYKHINVKFYTPIKDDFIQRLIYENKTFYEIGMLEDIRKRIGNNKIIVDIGANIGNHTVYFAKICKAKQVYSFEPQKNIFDILQKNLEINNISNKVKLYNMGVGKEHFYASIDVLDTNNYGMSKINKMNKGSVEINSLDSLLLKEVDSVDMIKIDVEGMELDVLNGAKEILKKYKPIIYIEAGTNREFDGIVNHLKQYQYNPIYRFNATPTYLFV